MYRLRLEFPNILLTSFRVFPFYTIGCYDWVVSDVLTRIIGHLLKGDSSPQVILQGIQPLHSQLYDPVWMLAGLSSALVKLLDISRYLEQTLGLISIFSMCKIYPHW